MFLQQIICCICNYLFPA